MSKMWLMERLAIEELVLEVTRQFLGDVVLNFYSDSEVGDLPS